MATRDGALPVPIRSQRVYPPSLVVGMLLALALAGVASAARGQQAAPLVDFVRLDPPQTGARATVGALVARTPSYLGADEHRWIALPDFDVQYANGFFAGLLNGIGVNLSTRSDLEFGVRGTVDPGRAEHRSPRLAGMGDVEAGLELGVFLNWRPVPQWRLLSALRTGAGEDTGAAIVDLGATRDWRVSRSLRLSATGASSFGNPRYMLDYFGVNAAQAARTGYPIYEPGRGWRDVRIALQAVFELDPRWIVSATAIRSRLVGDAADSPLAARRDQSSFAVSIGWRL